MYEDAKLAETILGPLTGMTITLIVALVVATYFYFRSRERQMMIEKGLTAEQMAELVKTKRNPYTWLKLGIITVCTGIGIGLGVMIEHSDGNPGLITLFIISFIGLGFVGAFFVSKRFEKEDNY